MARLASLLTLFATAVALLLGSVVEAQSCVCVTIWKRKRNGRGTTKTITKCGSPDFYSYSSTPRGWPYRKYNKCCIEGLGDLTKSCYRESKRRACGGYSQPSAC